MPSEGKVFFNNEQEINRDLSKLVIQLYAEQRRNESLATNYTTIGKDTNGLKVLDVFSASGIRAIRYYQEIPEVSFVALNDLDEVAVRAARKNLEINNIPPSDYKVTQDDANIVMEHYRRNQQFFDVIDLDPFGSASPFLKAAICCVNEGGLMCVTCTDTMTFSHQPKVCFQKYGSVPVRAACFHELALRMLLHRVETFASESSKYIVPILSISVDHYIRVFVRVFQSSAKALQAMEKMAYIYQSNSSPEFYLQPLHAPLKKDIITAVQKGTQFDIGGPIWASPIHDPKFIEQALNRINQKEEGQSKDSRWRLYCLLKAISREAHEVPLYYKLTPGLSSMAKVRHMPKVLPLLSALQKEGYSASRMHRDPFSIKTNAPIHHVCQLVKEWDRQKWVEKVQKDPNLRVPHTVNLISANPSVDFELLEDFEREENSFSMDYAKQSKQGPQAK